MNDMSCQSLVASCQLSVVGCQWSVINIIDGFNLLAEN
jgi:hypothetical protein